MEATPQLAPTRRSDGADAATPIIVDILGRADYDAFRERLAEDVVFHSPVDRLNFRGRDITSAQFERLVKQSDLDYWGVEGYSKVGDAHVVALTTRVHGH